MNGEISVYKAFLKLPRQPDYDNEKVGKQEGNRGDFGGFILFASCGSPIHAPFQSNHPVPRHCEVSDVRCEYEF